MEIVVCNGSYLCDGKKKFARTIILDEQNNIYFIKSGGKYFFPGFIVEDETSLDQVRLFVDYLFDSNDGIEFYTSLDYYDCVKSKDKTGKRISKNYLTTNNYYIVRLNRNSNLIGYRNIMQKSAYSDLFKGVNSSYECRYNEEMKIILRMLPEDLKVSKSSWNDSKKLNLRR